MSSGASSSSSSSKAVNYWDTFQDCSSPAASSKDCGSATEEGDPAEPTAYINGFRVPILRSLLTDRDKVMIDPNLDISSELLTSRQPQSAKFENEPVPENSESSVAFYVSSRS